MVKQPAAPRLAVATAAPTAMPSHPDDKLDVDDMKVNDLRRELKKRLLLTTGRKAELQERLSEYLACAKQKREADWAAKHASVSAKDESATTQLKQVKIMGNAGQKKNVNEMDVVMEDPSEAEDVSMRGDGVEAEPAAKATAIEAKDPPVGSESAVKEAKPSNYQPSGATKQAPKSALKPSKYASGFAHGTPQLDDQRPASKPVPGSLAKQLMPTKVSDSSMESTSSNGSDAPSKATKMQSSVQKAKVPALAQTTPVGSAFKAKLGGAGSAKLQEKKMAISAASEARKERLAAMRQKVRFEVTMLYVFCSSAQSPNHLIRDPIHNVQSKPALASASSATKPPASHSKFHAALGKKPSSSALGESKSSSLVAKMREKATAEKITESANAAATAVAAPVSNAAAIAKPSNSMVPSSPAAVKRVSQMTTAPQASIKPSSTALKSILDPANKPATKPSPKKVEEKPLSPMQTYDMSDRDDESDSESESDEEYESQRPKKKVSKD